MGVMETSSYWTGYITGTNRGRVWLKIDASEGRVTAKASLFDHQVGPATIRFEGSQPAEGSSLELRLVAFSGSPAVTPLDGGITITLGSNSQPHSVGSWWTDIGTSGAVIIRPIRLGWLKFMTARIRAFFLRYCPGTVGFLYVFGLFGLGLLGALGVIGISAWQLILMLLPGPFLLRRQIKAILGDLGVSKAGPFEFNAQVPPESMGVTERPLEVDGTRPSPQQITAYLAKLDEFFAPITKSLLIMVSLFPNGMDVPQFFQMAKGLGAQEANIPMIFQAITGTGVAELRDGRLVLTNLGRTWLQRWKHITATQLPNSKPDTTEGA